MAATLSEIRELIQSLTKTANEIKAMLERNSAGKPTGIEEAAAKIIKDIGDKIDQCECTKKIEEMLDQKQNADTQIVPTKQESSGLVKYSYPNWNVGNEELGSSGNPNAVKWPPRK
ncbi:unnamed protein product [Figwort mosaic virus]|uniref:Virion-associated protein n=1 Tax=Figwort mosaic virus (strain DxS) TaxID=10650 RepID=VAP_FMVD|nr:unnamed protein product [Figwort mosaic virus]P09522.1 RecName: Full=Virion-associated protein; Short=Vap; AltName: Full=Protein 3; Short=P3 [Figwort mosaic virus (STRAIN DXS)]CAA29525.1 unnamed protein product [Figwort mosaic virus]